MYLILMYIVAEYESMFINVVYTPNDWALYINYSYFSRRLLDILGRTGVVVL